MKGAICRSYSIMRSGTALILILILAVVLVGGFILAVNRSGVSTVAYSPSDFSADFASSTASTASSTSNVADSSSTAAVARNYTSAPVPGAPNTGGSLNTSTRTPTPKSTPAVTPRATQPTNVPTPAPTSAPATNAPAPTSAPTTNSTRSYSPGSIAGNGSSQIYVSPGARNIVALSFTVTAPSDSSLVVSELELGSANGNDFFNNLETFKLYAPDGSFYSALNYSRRLANWHPVFTVAFPVVVPAGTSMRLQVLADLKPGVTGKDVPALTVYSATTNIAVPLSAFSGNPIRVQ
jgi:hypothetical protein